MIHKITKMFVHHAFIVILYLKLRNIYYGVDDFIRKSLGLKPSLYFLEYHIADHCNMNCKGCFHFSNIVPTKTFPSFEQFSRDINRLSEIFGNISTIRLMGGEPLLNPQLPMFAREARKAFPKAKIAILSNGMWYKKVRGELVETIISNNAEVQISLYKPMMKYKDDIKQHFDTQKIKHSISGPILKFAKYINAEGDSNPKESVKQCPASRCTFLSDGHIARCPLPFNIKFFNQQFNQSIDMEHEKINIHDAKWTGFALKKKLRKPMSSCRYCGKLEWFDWEKSLSDRSEMSMEDFCCRNTSK